MPKRIFKRFMPDHRKIRDHKHMKFFSKFLHDPNLWHLNRRSVAGAFSVGLFMAFLPLPFQMFFAAAAAIPMRVNLPISVGLVWLTNPLTMPPVFYSSYKIGSWILDTPPRPITFDASMDWLTTNLGAVGAPFIVGTMVLAVASAILGNFIVRLFWRLQIIRYIRKRQLRKRKPDTGE